MCVCRGRYLSIHLSVVLSFVVDALAVPISVGASNPEWPTLYSVAVSSFRSVAPLSPLRPKLVSPTPTRDPFGLLAAAVGRLHLGRRDPRRRPWPMASTGPPRCIGRRARPCKLKSASMASLRLAEHVQKGHSLARGFGETQAGQRIGEAWATADTPVAETDTAAPRRPSPMPSWPRAMGWDVRSRGFSQTKEPGGEVACHLVPHGPSHGRPTSLGLSKGRNKCPLGHTNARPHQRTSRGKPEPKSNLFSQVRKATRMGAPRC